MFRFGFGMFGDMKYLNQFSTKCIAWCVNSYLATCVWAGPNCSAEDNGSGEQEIFWSNFVIPQRGY